MLLLLLMRLIRLLRLLQLLLPLSLLSLLLLLLLLLLMQQRKLPGDRLRQRPRYEEERRVADRVVEAPTLLTQPPACLDRGPHGLSGPGFFLCRTLGHALQGP
jgi:hypothetical protein